MTETGTCSNKVFNCKVGHFCPTEQSTVVDCQPCSEGMVYGQSCYCEEGKPIRNCQECAGNQCSKCGRKTFLENNICITCPLDCDTCADANSCITCSEGYEKNPQTGLCKLSCKSEDGCMPVGLYFGNPGTQMPIPCIANCLSCSSTTTCDFCDPKGFVITLTGQCTKKCNNIQDGQYCDNGIAKHCDKNLTAACKCYNASYCASCDFYAQKCGKCLPHMHFNSDGECAVCYDGFSLESSQCMPCTGSQLYPCTCKTAKNCSTCHIIAGTCKTCLRNFDFKGEIPCQNCLPGFYKENSAVGDTCVPCIDNCLICSLDTNCTICKNGFLFQSGKCEKTCKIGDRSCASNQICDKICKDCTGNCATCKGSVDKCVTCKSGFILENNKCAACGSNCLNCDGDKSKCKLCKDGFLNFDGGCITCIGNSTQKCNCGKAENCATCDAKNSNVCETCLPGFFKGNNLETDTCKACNEKCATCTQENTCSSCKNGHVLTGNTCVSCTNTQATVCICTAAKNCQTCDSTDMGKCKTCINNFDPDGSTPCQNCLPGFFKSADSGNDTCTVCPVNCTTCTSGSVCTACKDGFSIENKNCVVCTDANCKTCPSNKDTCTVCKDGFSVQNNKCVKQCSSSTECRSNQICDTICKDCTGNCAICQDTVDTCLTCEFGFTLENDKCSACPNNCANCEGDKNNCKICKEGFFAKDNTCTKCDGNNTEQCRCGEAVNCATCDSSNKGKCGNCITGYKKADNETCSACADDYLMVGIACVKCNNNCATCSKTIKKCDTCANSHTMSINQTCEKDCKSTLTDGKACTADSIVECGASNQITACKCSNAANCFKCHNKDKGKCESCMKGYKLENQQCTTCLEGATAVGTLCFLQGDTPNTNISSGTVAGIVIAVLAVVGGVAGGVFWYMKKSKTNQDIERLNFILK
ncbi:Cysteine-rich membrane protein 2 [Spironucleus salmonicida]|uniref:Cysteine-rich membrane protein 2 n=1 Tax=Spironucleus salmonicida TaxID=348837 RepID=V6LX22_9EUKA|nr:Cysteine-rich membrane protein 2 [Spironucleus salmonicida]|eukprot:EST45364.1 Cysteine-rich membrane protein 2 [Spironucleus salmonicida]